VSLPIPQPAHKQLTKQPESTYCFTTVCNKTRCLFIRLLQIVVEPFGLFLLRSQLHKLTYTADRLPQFPQCGPTNRNKHPQDLRSTDTREQFKCRLKGWPLESAYGRRRVW